MVGMERKIAKKKKLKVHSSRAREPHEQNVKCHLVHLAVLCVRRL